MAAILAAIATAQVAPKPTKIGEVVPDFELPTFQNGDGRQNLADFAGQPVVLVFWSFLRQDLRDQSHLEDLIRMDRQLRSRGVATMFLESSKAATDDVQALMWRICRGFDGRIGVAKFAMPLPAIEDPTVMVIGCDGRLVAVEKVDRWFSNVLVEFELERLAKGWGETPEIAKVRAALHGQGAIATAQSLAAALTDAPTRDRLLAEVETVFARRLAAIEWLTKAGNLVDAKAIADELQAKVANAPALQARIAPLLTTFAAATAKKALDVDQRLAKLLEKVRDGKYRGELMRDLDALAKLGKDTAVAPRIQKLIEIVRYLQNTNR